MSKRVVPILWLTWISLFGCAYYVSFQTGDPGPEGVWRAGGEALRSRSVSTQSFDGGGAAALGGPGAARQRWHRSRWGIGCDEDDGTEFNDALWFGSGYQSSLNYLGRIGPDAFDAGLRFTVDRLAPDDEVVHARLRFAAFGGEITSAANLLIRGILLPDPAPFSQAQRPSQTAPKTQSSVLWTIDEPWATGDPTLPFYYSSPDVSKIINEILALPGWGQGAERRKIAFTIDDVSGAGTVNYVVFDDFEYGMNVTTPVVLEVCETVRQTFLGREMLGRISDSSVVINLYSLIEIDVAVEYGTMSGVYTYNSPLYIDHPAKIPIEITLNDLAPDQDYFYRVVFRRSDAGGSGDIGRGAEHSFHTQRARAQAFTFSVQADEHLLSHYRLPADRRSIELYDTTLRNIANDAPDFLISLGDFALPEYLIYGNAKTLEEAKERYLIERSHLDQISHSIPFYLVVGNHEGEEGWYDLGQPGDLCSLATRARRAIIPNPSPDFFYDGNTQLVPGVGLREDYYAWEWGDALFVVLCPFWETKSKPHHKLGTSGSQNGWDWTLGKEQYDWLYNRLADSTAKWKFVFIHHLTSAALTGSYYDDYYGRGGIEAAKFHVDGNPSFEWGGEDQNGSDVFQAMRPGWSHGPIHDLLVAQGVSILFHGHDHLFALQELDGVVYLECPVPWRADYGYGKVGMGRYKNGVILPNSGHIRVGVGPDRVTIDYVRSFLPGEGLNGGIAHSHTIR